MSTSERVRPGNRRGEKARNESTGGYAVPTGRHRRAGSDGDTTGRRRLVQTSSRPNRVAKSRAAELGRYFWGGLMMLGAPALFYLVLDNAAASRVFLIREVNIKGNSLLSREEILQAANLATAQHLLAVNAQEMESRIEALPWVKDAQVDVSMRGEVNIQVQEAKLAGVVAAGELYLVDTDGDPIRRWTPSDGLSRPLFVGFTQESAGTTQIDKAALMRGYELAEAFESSGLGAQRDVREVQVATANTYRLTLDDGMEVRLAEDRLDERLARLTALSAELARNGTSATHVVLDGDDLNHVAYQERVAAVTGGGG